MRHALLIAIGTGSIALAASLVVAQHPGHQHHHGHMPSAPDAREVVSFPPPLVEHTLANMRDHLQALQEITSALAIGRHDDAAKIAEMRLGMSALQSHGAHAVAQYMPKGMQEAGTAMHRAASRFAIEAQNAGVNGDLRPALAGLGEVMSACVTCHAGYRFK